MVFIIIWVKITLSTGLNFSCYEGIFRLLWSSFHHLIHCKSLKYRIYLKEAKKFPCCTPAIAVTVIPISIAAAVGRHHSPCHDCQGHDSHHLIAACTILAPLIHPVSSCSQWRRGMLGHPGVSRVLSQCCSCILLPGLVVPVPIPSSSHSARAGALSGSGGCFHHSVMVMVRVLSCHCAHPHNCARCPCPASRHLWQWGWVGHHP
jgi:hypothetical protein